MSMHWWCILFLYFFHFLSLPALTHDALSLSTHFAYPRDSNKDAFPKGVQPVEKPDAPPDPQKVWECLCKGASLEFYIRRGIYEANVPSANKQPPGSGNLNTPSAFTDPNTQLASWRVPIPPPLTAGMPMAIDPALQALGADDLRDYLYWSATRSYIVGSDSRSSQFASYMSPKNGIVVATNSRSAQKSDPWPSNIPRQWSDVIFLGWKSVCKAANPQADVSSLRYILRQTVSNQITLGVIDSYAPNVGAWPGKSFDINSRGGQALLGTPNGYGIAFMLLQHQAELGNKKVQKVTAWHAGIGGKCLLFELGDEQDPTEPMAVDWEWVSGDGDEIMLDARSIEDNGTESQRDQMGMVNTGEKWNEGRADADWVA